MTGLLDMLVKVRPFTKSQRTTPYIGGFNQRPMELGADHVDFCSPMRAAVPLEIRDLTCRYGEDIALDQVSLKLAAGTIVGITGSPGAGISTLIKAIMLLVAPLAGRVLIYGKPHELASSRAHLAYLPEAIRPPGHLSGQDFIRMAGTVRSVRVEASDIDGIASDLDLDPGLLPHPIRRYAKDDVQKLGLLCLFATERSILLLDRPMSELEPPARASLRHRLKRHAANGGAVLIGSPDIEDHQDIADSLLILKDGRLAALETVRLFEGSGIDA